MRLFQTGMVLKASYACRLNNNRWSQNNNGFQANMLKTEYNKLLSNENTNFKIFNNAIKALGSVPATLGSNHNSMCIPEEKSVIVCVVYLCARLLESSRETHAAIKLQICWRDFQRKKYLAKFGASAMIIQQATRRYLKRANEKKLRSAALALQSHFRAWHCRFKYIKIIQATICIQKQQE